MKTCPFCAESIQDKAVKCRYCSEFLTASGRRSTPWYFSTAIIVVALLAVGPLALPLVWVHPRCGLATKIVVTVLIMALTAGLIVVTRDLYRSLSDQLQPFFSWTGSGLQ